MELFTEVLNGLVVPTIVVLCGITGYLIKQWISDVDNKFIPTIVTIEGVAAACIIAISAKTSIDLSVIVGGMASGLLSTGCHQLIKTWTNQFSKSGE